MSNHIDQIVQFDEEIAAVVKRFTLEYDLPIVSAVGVLMLRIRIMQDSAFNNPESEG